MGEQEFVVSIKLFFFFHLFRAQNDANFRKEKIQPLKRCDNQSKANKSAKAGAVHIKDENANFSQSPSNQQKDEKATHIDKLFREIEMLKEMNRSLADKAQVIPQF